MCVVGWRRARSTDPPRARVMSASVVESKHQLPGPERSCDPPPGAWARKGRTLCAAENSLERGAVGAGGAAALRAHPPARKQEQLIAVQATQRLSLKVQLLRRHFLHCGSPWRHAGTRVTTRCEAGASRVSNDILYRRDVFVYPDPVLYMVRSRLARRCAATAWAIAGSLLEIEAVSRLCEHGLLWLRELSFLSSSVFNTSFRLGEVSL